MAEAVQMLKTTRETIQNWGWIKRILLLFAILTFIGSTFFYMTPPGLYIREWLAQTVIMTQHRDWAWIFVGEQRRDEMVDYMHQIIEENGIEPQQHDLIKFVPKTLNGKLVEVEDVSGTLWKGKKMYVYDPRTIRVVVPSKAGEGERVSSMVQRTGAIAGVNGGGFVDPEGLGNGFAPIGPIIAGGEIVYNDVDGSVPFQMVGFTKEGTLIIGKYSIDDLMEQNVSEAVMFYPRIIANGKPLQIASDGRHPRTGVCQKEDGTVIFLVIDGRQTHSVGATLKEVQDMFMADGCINAGFLDGGASSELVYKNELITSPASRYGERRLPSAFLVFEDPAKLHNLNPWDGVKKIDPGGSHDHPDFIKEMQSKPKPTPTPTPKPTPTPDPKDNKPSPSPGTSPSPSPGTSPSPSPGTSPSPSPGGSPKPTPTPTPGNGGTNPGTSPTPPPSPTPTPTPGTTPGGTPTPSPKPSVTPEPTPKATQTPAATNQPQPNSTSPSPTPKAQ